jgi:heme oxygenase
MHTGSATHRRRGAADVLRQLRMATATEHAAVESALDLLDPALTRERLIGVLIRLHGFWAAAESGLQRWADRHPADADSVAWPRRRRTALFATDLRALGGNPMPDGAGPTLPTVADTDAALGRLYVLEGSSLGGVLIDRHLRTLPALADARLRAFSPYGDQTGAMWAEFRRVTRTRAAAGGDAGRMVTGARSTFAALAAWCAPAPIGPPP